MSSRIDLHDESFEADRFKSVRVVVVEFQIVMEDEAALHVGRHSDADRNSSFELQSSNMKTEVVIFDVGLSLFDEVSQHLR